MSVVQFQCPSCQAPLRLENRALFVGRTFDCPDCRESLLIEAEGSAGVTATRLHKLARSASKGRESKSASPSLALRVGLEARSSASDRRVSLQLAISAWDRLSRRPAVLGWIVATLLAVILLVAVNAGREQSLHESLSSVTAEAQAAGNSSGHNSPPSPTDEQKSQAAAVPDPTIPEVDAKAVVQMELPPLPEPATVVEPPRDDKPAAIAEKPPTEEPTPAVLSPEAVEAKLQQKIARFEQSRLVSFVKVLDTVEELAGVPIVWDLDRVDEQQLQKPVTLHLKQTTVAEILDMLLKQVGLERRTVEGKIELRPSVQKD